MTRISLAFIFVELMSGLALGQPVVVTPEETGQTAAAEVALENASTQVALRDGRIVSLLDKTRSVLHVVAEADSDRGLFRIQLVEGVKPAGEVDATQMTSQVRDRAGDGVEIEFEHPKVTACVRVRLSPSPEGTRQLGGHRLSPAVDPRRPISNPRSASEGTGNRRQRVHLRVSLDYAVATCLTRRQSRTGRSLRTTAGNRVRPVD